jgi:hypothetical protein
VTVVALVRVAVVAARGSFVQHRLELRRRLGVTASAEGMTDESALRR